jgi:glycine/D-amino acid oxidase-like deaminating enzyme/nitrite reductase/ring-hydroxylating ferredoxin subunit
MATRKAATSGQTLPSWVDTAQIPSFSKLSDDLNTEVCIVGAGLGGLTAAYLLAVEGKKVVVLEDGTIGSGETGRTTAHIVNAVDDRYSKMAREHGERKARLIAESHTAAIDEIERICDKENIICDFERLDGYLFIQPGKEESLQDEHDAARKAGIKTELVGNAPAPFYTGEALKFPGQGTFHPMKYLAGLARAVVRMGGKIYTGTHVNEIKGAKLCKVGTDGGHAVYADSVVVATNSPINTWVKIHSKQAPYRTFVVALRVPKGSVDDILLWDTGNPYHYVRLQHVPNKGNPDYDLLIVGGEDHKTGQEDDADERFAALERWARDRYPMAGKTEYQWSGQVMEPVDGVAYIGRSPGEENIYMITGDSGNGMTHCTLGAMLVRDLIFERANAWEDVYDPSRVKLHPSSVATFAKENLNVAVQYTDYVRGGDVDSTREIKRGEGAIVTRGLKKLAMYRDNDGELHERSAVCTHLGCCVQWNSTEKSWDCPCHGSRFTPKGDVISGPASAPLKDPSEDEEKGKESAGAEA